MKFTGTKNYVATDDLKVAVNAAIVLERPLLVKGEPGTGKTVLAEEVAKALDLDPQEGVLRLGLGHYNTSGEVAEALTLIEGVLTA